MNPLLVHDDVGHAKPSTWILPSSEHAFGKEYNRDYEGANISKHDLILSHKFLEFP